MNQGLITATNVIPAAGGYRAMKNTVAISNSADGRIRGIFSVKDNNGDVTLFAGDAGTLRC